MAANQGPQERPNAASVLDTMLPGLSSSVLAETGKQAESLDTVHFMFQPWCRIPNVTLAGFSFGVQYPYLERMQLIPLKVWRTPVIQPRAGGFAVGSFSGAGAFPSGGVGSKVEQRLQFPRESVDKLLQAYGEASLTGNNLGMTILSSLSADTDDGKLQSLLLYRAVMETSLEGEPTGAQTILERIPGFLRTAAPILLKRGVDRGIEIGNNVLKVSPRYALKGEKMIEDIRVSVAAATNRALNEHSGVLSTTKQDLIKASKGQKDVKIIPDNLDNWLMAQFPSYSLDTEVERAARANQEFIKLIQANQGTPGAGPNEQFLEMLKMQQQLLDQLTKAQETNAELMKQMVVKSAA